MSRRQQFTRLLAGLTLLVPTAGAFAATAGVFQFVAGDVTVNLAGGSQRPAAKGVLVSVGDTITTAKASMAQVKMGDGAVIVIQPESQVKVAEFRYAGKEDGTEKVTFRLEQGGLRSVTGAIGHTNKSNYMIETPIAHIGVRGTDHESWYFPSAATLEGSPTDAGVYDKVNVGQTYIETPSGEVGVLPNEVGFVSSALDQPRLLDTIPVFFSRSIPVVANRDSGQGMAWGKWQGGLMTASLHAGNSNMPQTVRDHLPSVASSHALPQQGMTAQYSGVGTLSGGGTASLSVGVNLTTATVTSYSLSASTGSQQWTGNGSGSFSQFMGSGINLHGDCTGCLAQNPSVTTGANGSATGMLSGPNLDTMFQMSSAQQQSISGGASLTSR